MIVLCSQDSWRESPCAAWREALPQALPQALPENVSPSGSAVATPHGIMSLRLHDGVRVDMSVDRAVRVINLKVRMSIPHATESFNADRHP